MKRFKESAKKSIKTTYQHTGKVDFNITTAQFQLKPEDETNIKQLKVGKTKNKHNSAKITKLIFNLICLRN